MENDFHKLATILMRDQVEIINKYGNELHLDKDRYEQTVKEIERVFEGMSSKPQRKAALPGAALI